MRMEITVTPSPTHRRAVAKNARAQQRTVSRWLIPLGAGLLSAVLIVIGTPHVAWYLRILLAIIAFLYISGQSAAYLWSSRSDQG